MLMRLLLLVVLTSAFASCPKKNEVFARNLIRKLDERFELIQGAAQWKWNYGMHVRDAERRQSLHYLTVRLAQAKGHDVEWSNRLVSLILNQSEHYQKSLYTSWRREGISLFPAPPNLRSYTDPRLDAITEEILDMLEDQRSLLKTPGLLTLLRDECEKLDSPRKFFIAPILGYIAPGRRPPPKGMQIHCEDHNCSIW